MYSSCEPMHPFPMKPPVWESPVFRESLQSWMGAFHNDHIPQHSQFFYEERLCQTGPQQPPTQHVPPMQFRRPLTPKRPKPIGLLRQNFKRKLSKINQKKKSFIRSLVKCTTSVFTKVKEAPVKENTENLNFLQAYPTKSFSNAELQSLLPEDWSRVCVEEFNEFEVIRREVNMEHQSFERIHRAFEGRVQMIEKVENPYLWLIYQLKRMDCEKMHNSAEHFLFHGTSGKNVYSIIKNNFNYRLAGSSVGHRSGKGVYFTYSAHFSELYARNGGRCVLLTKTLVGRMSVGSEDTELPEPACDTTTNGRSIIVKYHDNEFYPVLLIHLTPQNKFKS
ncbi:protein mono-ADP-ribosyltransferase PARP14-like [Neocloeon triangulifer]|uniref:protein mono-ADP-ribosyltransferase PARP14-like n=1 Tax=Neocloeon triangulifer TaxID=2078957 RepID=UPI00286F977A|nr:protein mono-ADP-ribosyltransferase PARP14-like [Neocloeon triangulifer]